MKNMKKLLIAAGIAAATVASFGASASAAFSDASYASINTTVTGNSSVSVVVTGKIMDLLALNAKGALLGNFAVTTPANSDYTNVILDDIHAHGYPADFKVDFKNGETVCTVDLTANGGVSVTDGDALPLAAGTCKFTTAQAVSIDVVTTESTTSANAGVKTITARFRAFHS